MKIRLVKNGICILVIFCECFIARAYENYVVGSRAMALSGCGVTGSDIWSVSQNQAGLAAVDNTNLGLYSEQRFLIKELSLNSLVFACPAKPGTLGLQMNYFGYTKYHEMKLGMAFASHLGEKIMAGVQLDYFNAYSATAENTRKRITFEAGIIVNPIKNITIGLHVFNPLIGKINSNTEMELPSIARFGVTYSIEQSVAILTETQYNFYQSPLLRVGIEYFPVKAVALRMGVSTGTSPYSFGIGYRWKKFTAGFGFANHPELGTTPAFDLVVSF